jgi:hypothetical protein
VIRASTFTSALGCLSTIGCNWPSSGKGTSHTLTTPSEEPDTRKWRSSARDNGARQ